MPSSLTTQENTAAQRTHASTSQAARATETQEHHAKASASGGLNLNLFGALSGALSSASRKTTARDAEGGEVSVEERQDAASASANAGARANAHAAAAAEQGSSKTRALEAGQSAAAGKAVGASTRVDHLGLEG
ncbi:hypothetical protein C7974DRAFT_393801 [Boeremia exigua]|uniref:uncharacterized protein n=1 Tax=Boeremia exigua TaxID=749465 RepID=UPI001E8DEA5E|nr:uncharacterized protein C7974DRAFT_393801 [Boeremia exigua]KAH6629082.1 hypothetical protein C7974DRAFT_393801 [Boeremia exigua]